MTELPLAGVRVIDLTHALAGSFCTHHLQLLGAEVTKVEPPGTGDDFRERPATFAAINAGKRSIVLDLKTSVGLEVLRALVEGADVLVENYRPGVTEKLGIDWPSLSAVKPSLIYCSITGYGQTGPLRNFPAIEWAVQAMSGMSAGYIADDVDGAYLGLGVLDPFSGYVAFSAVLAALLQRSRSHRGQRIDVSMLDAAMVLLGPRIVSQQLGERDPASAGRRPTMVRFRAQDRRIFIAALHRKWFVKLAELLDAPELAEDPRFRNHRAQAEHADELIAAIEQRLALRPAAEWEALLVNAGLPASVVRTLEEMLAHPHVAQRGALEAIDFPDLDRRLNVMGAGFRFEHDQPAFQGHVPRLGEHTAEVLDELGMADRLPRT